MRLAQTPTLASSAAPGPDGDAAADGTPPCPHCDGARFVRVTSAIDDPHFGEAIPCACVRREDERERRDRLLRYSRLGALSHMTFGTLLRDGRSEQPGAGERYRHAVEVAERFADSPQGWLVLSGVAGCGKTHLAAAIANRAIEEGRPALFLSVADLLDQLRASYDEEGEAGYPQLLEQLRSAPLVVLDDLDSYAETAWAREKFFQLVSHRFYARLPTVFTCVRPPSDIDPRLGSRLTDPAIAQALVLQQPGEPAYFQIGGMTRERLQPFTFERFSAAGFDLRGTARRNLEGAYRLARHWAEEPDGWLLFRGDNGCGKTHLAGAIANYRLDRGDSVCFANVPDLLDQLRAAYAPDAAERFDAVFARLLEVPLLVLDDFGAHQASPWAQEKLYQLLNHRHLARLPTVVTTNVELRQMERRIASRLADTQIAHVYEITAPDYRTTALG